MARNKSNTLNPAMYGLTQQDVERVIRIHTMCKDMDEDAFEQMETAAASINLVASLKKLDENTAFLDECRKNREDSKAKYMQVKALCGEFKAIYGQHCDTVRTMENVVRGSQSFLTSAIDNLTIVSKGYPFYAALMDSLLDGLPAKKKEE